MNKLAFLFYLDYEDVFKSLEADDCKTLILLMIDYVKNLTEPNENLKTQFSDRLLMAWLSIKRDLDRDDKRYDKRCETSRENGKKGGRPKKNKNLNNLTETYEPDVEVKVDINIYSNCNSYIKKKFKKEELDEVEEELLKTWLMDFENNETLIKYAIDISILNDKKNMGYVNGILSNWKKAGYKIKEDVLESERLNQTNDVTQKNPIELFDYDWINE